MVRITNSYDIRETLSQVGGCFDRAARRWELTDEQYDELMEQVEYAGTRSNKRDRALYVGYQRAEVSRA